MCRTNKNSNDDSTQLWWTYLSIWKTGFSLSLKRIILRVRTTLLWVLLFELIFKIFLVFPRLPILLPCQTFFQSQWIPYTMTSWTPPIAQWWYKSYLHDLCSYSLIEIPLVSSLVSNWFTKFSRENYWCENLSDRVQESYSTSIAHLWNSPFFGINPYFQVPGMLLMFQASKISASMLAVVVGSALNSSSVMLSRIFVVLHLFDWNFDFSYWWLRVNLRWQWVSMTILSLAVVVFEKFCLSNKLFCWENPIVAVLDWRNVRKLSNNPSDTLEYFAQISLFYCFCVSKDASFKFSAISPCHFDLLFCVVITGERVTSMLT